MVVVQKIAQRPKAPDCPESIWYLLGCIELGLYISGGRIMALF